MSNDTRFHRGDVLEGRLEVIRAIRGGVGEVYLCVDRSNQRPFALKRLQTRYAGMPKFSEAFRREAETWIQLGDHPNIVPVVVLETIYGEPVLLLEWIFGPDGSDPDLGNRMRARRLDPRTILEIGIDVCRGLVHAAFSVPSIVHRDLKPANILIGSQGEARITDFGLAKSALDANVSPSEAASETGAELNPAAGGTPRYMAPEQWTGSELDARTDVYALGAVLFEALSGHSVYLGPALEDFRRQHLTAPVPTLELSTLPSRGESLNAILSRCLAKSKNERPAPSALQDELSELYRQLFGEAPSERPAQTSLTPRDWNNRAVTFHSLGRPEEAVVQFRQALELDPGYAFARGNYAATLISLGRIDDALAELNRAILDDPNSTIALVNRARIYTDQHRLNDALADYQRAIDIDPARARAYLGRARAFERSGKLNEALQDLETATRLGPLNGSAWQLHGDVLRDLGRKQDAIQSFTRAIAVRDNAAFAYLLRGLTYFDLGDDRLAMEDSNAAIGLDRKLTSAYLLRAHAGVHLWRSTADYETLGAAVRDFSRVIELDPSVYAAYVGRGKILSDNYQEEAAIADFTRAIALDAGYAMAYINRGNAYVALKDTDRGLADLARGIELEPQRVEGYADRGAVYANLKRFDEAIADLQQALELDPNYALGHYNLGVLLANRGDLAESLRAIERAAALGMQAANQDVEWLRGEIEKRKSKR